MVSCMPAGFHFGGAAARGAGRAGFFAAGRRTRAAALALARVFLAAGFAARFGAVFFASFFLVAMGIPPRNGAIRARSAQAVKPHGCDAARSPITAPARRPDPGRAEARPRPRSSLCEGGRPRLHAMRYLALATDYDGTLAADGTVSEQAIAALGRLRKSGRRAVLVTGRELPDLLTVCPRLDLFDRVVAENGALLYRPQTRDELVLAEPPPPELAERLRGRGVPVSEGRVIVAMREPHQLAAVEVIRDLGLELQVIFNKGAVMLLPPGVDKQTGLEAALDELGLSPRNTVAVGDAENDEAMLAACGCGAAVANAVPSLKDRADLVLRGARGQGVEELIARLIEDDLRLVI
jgi:hydroxymethylpyrimidine pyrophosphatase-like HAD family hydrolase